MLFNILLYALIGALVLIGVLFVLLIPLFFVVRHYARKFIWNMPIMTWITLEDTEKFGVPLIIRMLVLKLLHEGKHLETRLKDNLDESETSIAEEHGFHFTTMELYEFRMTVTPRRKRRKTDILSFLKKFFPDFEPPPAPA
jgi:hypothetical protein